MSLIEFFVRFIKLPGMSSFSERAALKRANDDRQPRDGKDAQGEPNPLRQLYQPIPERQLRLVRSNGVLVVKEITSTEPTAPGLNCLLINSDEVA